MNQEDNERDHQENLKYLTFLGYKGPSHIHVTRFRDPRIPPLVDESDYLAIVGGLFDFIAKQEVRIRQLAEQLADQLP